MCNLYSFTTNQAAIIALFRVLNRYVRNLPPMTHFRYEFRSSAKLVVCHFPLAATECRACYWASSIGSITGNVTNNQLLLGHTKIESTVRYLGIEVDDALAIAEQVDV
jgi:hypothetical protein